MAQQRFTVNTKHGSFGTDAENSNFVLLYRNRIPSAKVQPAWVRSKTSAEQQEKRMKSLGFQTLGIFETTEHVLKTIPRKREEAVKPVDAIDGDE
ncbi:MAG: hypothetical protein GY833_12385 [Aestuariibacter sp.]|nr:hypothetical protein [Aestuariibacter sp.]